MHNAEYDGVQSGGASGGAKLTEVKQHTVLFAFVTDDVVSYYALCHAEEGHITTACVTTALVASTLRGPGPIRIHRRTATVDPSVVIRMASNLLGA
jgi:hypothetical protein